MWLLSATNLYSSDQVPDILKMPGTYFPSLNR